MQVLQRPMALRYITIAAVLLLGVGWAFASAVPAKMPAWPNARFLIDATELRQRLSTEPLVVVDVRDDEHFDGKLIPGAVRLPWSEFRQASAAANMGGLFVGVAEAQKILGRHGIFRNDTVILYDSIARDGGATASYVFWVLDLLGHENMAILEQGIDAWIAAGGEVSNAPETREPLLYQAPADEIELRRLADESFIYPRLGDPYYQILDVRSRGEYLGEKLNTALDGSPLKAGHIPGAVNINYEANWVDTNSKKIRSYDELLQLYRGLDRDRAVITYCHSARRSSFGYFILRLMGFRDVILYDNSWFGWGRPDAYYPVETAERSLPERAGTGMDVEQRETRPAKTGASKTPDRQQADDKGYVSCGG